MKESRGVYRVLVGKSEGKTPLGRPRHRWDDNIKMDLWEVVCGTWTVSVWIRIGTGEGQLRMRNEPSGSIKCGECCD
jgi:hypothetical protein